MSSYPPPGPGPKPSVDRRIEEAMERIQTELRQAIAYVNDAVVPQVRRESISAMRTMADKLRKLADQIDSNSKPPSAPPGGSAHVIATGTPLLTGGRIAGLAGLAAVLLVVSGCGHRQRVAQQPPPQALPPQQPAYVPPPPPQYPSQVQTEPLGPIPVTPVPPGGVSPEDLQYVATHRPIATQEGLASWYSAPYKGRKAANGQVFDDQAMTAAHRTLPMGSLIVVTNLSTGQSSAMRITDRGPFVTGRVVDLTIASAKATGIYLHGTARVRVDVYETPKPIATGGRWCVQIGAFHSEREAIDLKLQLLATYADSDVIEFAGENSYWVRIRPQGDNREMAVYIAQHLHPVEGEAFLTRLD